MKSDFSEIQAAYLTYMERCRGQRRVPQEHETAAYPMLVFQDHLNRQSLKPAGLADLFLHCIHKPLSPRFSELEAAAVYPNHQEVFLVKVKLRENETQQNLLKRFRKKLARSGKMSAVRKKRWFVSKSELRRIQQKKAIRKQKRRQS